MGILTESRYTLEGYTYRSIISKYIANYQSKNQIILTAKYIKESKLLSNLNSLCQLPMEQFKLIVNRQQAKSYLLKIILDPKSRLFGFDAVKKIIMNDVSRNVDLPEDLYLEILKIIQDDLNLIKFKIDEYYANQSPVPE